MRSHILRALSVAAAAGGTVVMTAGLALPSAASTAGRAAAGPLATFATAHEGGYITGGGRHFRFIQATVQVSPARSVLQFAAVELHGTQHPVAAVFLGVKAGGGTDSVRWSTSVPPFHSGGGESLHNLTPHVGDLLRMSIFFNQSNGHVSFTAVDNSTGQSQTITHHVPTFTLYSAAEAAVWEFGYGAPVANDFKLWSYTNCKVTTVSGVTGTMLGPWTTDKLVAVNSSGQVVMGPSVLFDNGADFNVLRR